MNEPTSYCINDDLETCPFFLQYKDSMEDKFLARGDMEGKKEFEKKLCLFKRSIEEKKGPCSCEEMQLCRFHFLLGCEKYKEEMP